jgi:hypothetical protein
MRIHAWLRSFHPCPKFNRGLVLDKKEKEKEIIRFNLVYEGGLGTKLLKIACRLDFTG